MLRFAQYITEGGNVKVGPKGQEVSAAPFPVSAADRSKRKKDVHDTLSSIHNSFHKEHGEHLFGANKQHLKSGHIFSGSSHDFMGKHVGDAEFAKHKPSVGDVDVQVHKDHKDKLASTLAAGKKFGKYTVVGTKKHGNEISAVMRHQNGEHHQFDFQGTHHPGSESDRFLHSSSWEDTKKGIKGAHHKILINAVGGDSHKFSITHGVRSRTDASDPGVSHPKDVAHKLFGHTANQEDIHSFHGVTKLIKKHIPKEQHQAIYSKFKSSLTDKQGMNHAHALGHLRTQLGVKDHVAEEVISEAQEHHVHVAFMGAAPHTHMGHHLDVVGGMGHGKKFVGLSGKSDVFSDDERAKIANKQSGGSAEFKVEKSAGQTVGRAFDSVKNNPGKKVLHLHFGHDRKEMAERLKSSIEAGKIPELEGHKPDAVHIHLPKDENRSHGMSGTKLRTAAEQGDVDTYHKHLGANFSKGEAKKIMDRTRVGLIAGKIKVKR